MTIHVTVTPATDPVRRWREIQGHYLDGNNVNGQRYGDLPYNDAVTLDGRILSGRRHKWNGAHAISANNTANRMTLGLAVIGTGNGITPAAKRAIRFYCTMATLEIGHRALLFDHGDWRGFGGIATACPGAELRAFVDVLNRERAAGRPWYR